MAHWSSAYIGRPYIDGEFDCGELARVVNREVFGRAIRVPAERGYIGKATAFEKFRAMAAQIEAEIPNCAEPTEHPEEGDGVLLQSRGYLQHIGIFCVVDGEPCVLHATDSAGQVVRQRIRDLRVRGLHVEGYYRWI